MLRCKGCHRVPIELSEFVEMADVFQVTPQQYVERYEETFDRRTERFYCTTCWEKAGMPVRTPTGGIVLLATKPVYPG